LLEADVNFRVVKTLADNIKSKALDAAILESLTPGQQIIKIIHEELVNVLGKDQVSLKLSRDIPTVIMLVGLQGSGKTTTALKLAVHLKGIGRLPLMVAADTRRPAALDQLRALGQQNNIPVYAEEGNSLPLAVCNNALRKSAELPADVVLLDTQGRLHMDDLLMQELVDIKQNVKPHEILLIVDSMTGQDAVRIAEEFNNRLNITGLILTKIDGDARGGAALSIRYVTGIPIKYLGTGEKAINLEIFYPDRMASRIMGMGDVITLIEKTQQSYDQQQAAKLERKLHKNDLNLEDFLEQLKKIQKMGPISQLLQMIPGFNRMPESVLNGDGENQLKQIEAIILSMTPQERRNPNIIDGSRKKRVAVGSGTSTKDVNQLLNQFAQVKKFTKMASQGTLPKNIMSSFKQ
jgi:signal recognition particle subunit SRP54